jgi:hypothetical protein
MKTNMQTTSLMAYAEVTCSGARDKQKQLILSKLSSNRNYSLREIQVLTNLDINAISARVFELKELKQLVHADFKRACSVTGRTIHPVMLPVADLLEAA